MSAVNDAYVHVSVYRFVFLCVCLFLSVSVWLGGNLDSSFCYRSWSLFPYLVNFVTAGQQDRRQIPGGARTHHDLSQVQHPEVLPGGWHNTLRSPCRHGRQRLLRPLCQNVSIVCKENN